jgi:hypothetical protein
MLQEKEQEKELRRQSNRLRVPTIRRKLPKRRLKH